MSLSVSSIPLYYTGKVMLCSLFSFMIGGNGKVYEGRGWKYSATKDSENMSWDWKSFDVAYIGSKEGVYIGDIDIQTAVIWQNLLRIDHYK